MQVQMRTHVLKWVWHLIGAGGACALCSLGGGGLFCEAEREPLTQASVATRQDPSGRSAALAVANTDLVPRCFSLAVRCLLCM